MQKTQTDSSRHTARGFNEHSLILITKHTHKS
jgi:hypothetical protein